MHKFLRWYNENRLTFWVILGIVLFIYLIIITLNGIVKEQNEANNSIAEDTVNVNSTSDIENSNSNSNSSLNYVSGSNNTTKSILSDKTISEATDTINMNLINSFVSYLNNGDVSSAYSLISDECKEVAFSSEETFKTYYYEKIFDKGRTNEIENWYAEGDWYTYYIKYTQDVVATGNSSSDEYYTDYITVVSTDDGYRLNINNYIGRESIEETEENSGVTLTVHYLDWYKDYVKVNISVKNSSINTICLDTKESTSSAYLTDSNYVKYSSVLTETANALLKINPGVTYTYDIKFSKIYNPDRELTSVSFTDIVLNYDNYSSGIEEKNAITMSIDL